MTVVLNFDMLYTTWRIVENLENHFWCIVIIHQTAHGTHFFLHHIKVVGQKYDNTICISNLRIQSDFPSQGYLDVLVIMFYWQTKQQRNQSHHRKADKPVAS